MGSFRSVVKGARDMANGETYHTHSHALPFSFTRPFERDAQNRGPALIQRVTLSWLMWQRMNV